MSRTMFRVSKSNGICERLIKEVRQKTLTYFRPNKLSNSFESQWEYRNTQNHVWCATLTDAELADALGTLVADLRGKGLVD